MQCCDSRQTLITYSICAQPFSEESFTLADFEELFNLAKRNGRKEVLAPQIGSVEIRDFRA